MNPFREPAEPAPPFFKEPKKMDNNEANVIIHRAHARGIVTAIAIIVAGFVGGIKLGACAGCYDNTAGDIAGCGSACHANNGRMATYDEATKKCVCVEAFQPAPVGSSTSAAGSAAP